MKSLLTYEIWKTNYINFLSELSNKRVIITYSGGKDSSVVLHLMLRAASEFGFKFETHSGVFPLHVLHQDEIMKLDSYWRKRGVPITWSDVKERDEELSNALSDGISPCLVCNRSKKRALMDYLKRNSYTWDNLVIVVCYSLWDLVSATVEHIISSIYRDSDTPDNLRGKSTEERFLETSQRFYPWLRLKNGLTIFKPLIQFNDPCILRVILNHSIPVTDTHCRYREFRPKRLFAEHYAKMNLQFDYERVFNFARKSLNIPDISFFENLQPDTYLKLMI